MRKIDEMFVVDCNLEAVLFSKYDEVERLTRLKGKRWMLSVLRSPGTVEVGVTHNERLLKADAHVKMNVATELLRLQIDHKSLCSRIRRSTDVDHATGVQSSRNVPLLRPYRNWLLAKAWLTIARLTIARLTIASRTTKAGLSVAILVKARLSIGWLSIARLLAISRRSAIRRSSHLRHSVAAKRDVVHLCSAANDHVSNSVLRNSMTKVREKLTIVGNLVFVWKRSDGALEVDVLVEEGEGAASFLRPPLSMFVGVADDDVAFEEPVVGVQSHVAGEERRSARQIDRELMGVGR